MRIFYWGIRLMIIGVALPGWALAQSTPLDLGISLPPSLNFATSPNPVGSGARAAGKGFAFIAVADDATAASWNPGGLTQLQQPELSIVGAYVARLEDQDLTQSNLAIDGQTIDTVNLNYLSVVYPFELWRRNVVASLNVQRLFDLHGDTDVQSRFTGIDGIQRVSSRQSGGLWTISPALAVQVTPAFSLGVAFNFWPDGLDNGWEQDVEVQGQGFVASGPATVPFRSRGKIDEDYDVKGFNVTVGFLWTINRIFTLGGVFRSPFTAELTRKHSSTLTVELQGRLRPGDHAARLQRAPRPGYAHVLRPRPRRAPLRHFDPVARRLKGALVGFQTRGIDAGRHPTGGKRRAVRQGRSGLAGRGRRHHERAPGGGIPVDSS